MTTKPNGAHLKSTNGGSFILPPEMLAIEFYLKPPVSDGFKVLKWDLSKLDKRPPGIRPNEEIGVFDRTLLRTIDLYREGGGEGSVLFAKLFAKVHHPARQPIPGYRGAESLEARVAYEEKNYRYWNVIGLPTPFYFGTFPYPVEVSGEAQSSLAHTVLMTHVDAPTHDLDFIVINDLIAKYRDALGDMFVQPEDKKKIRTNIELLEKEKERIVHSILTTQIRTQLLGTHHLDIARAIGLTVRQPADPVAEAHKMRAHYLLEHYLHQLVAKNTLSLEEARSFSEFNSSTLLQLSEEKYRKEVADPFTTLSTPILQALYGDPSLLRYVQGDEFPWHYAYKPRSDAPDVHLARLATGIPLKVHSTMFDSNNAKISIPEEGIAHILFSPLIGLTPKQAGEAVSFYHQKLLELAKHYASTSLRFNGRKIKRRSITSLVPSHSDEELLDRVQLTAMMYAFNYFGLKAKDQIRLKDHNMVLQHRELPYNSSNSFVTFPSETIAGIDPVPKKVSYEPYSASRAIPLLRTLIGSCVGSFLIRQRSPENPYKKLEDTVKALNEHFIAVEFRNRILSC